MSRYTRIRDAENRLVDLEVQRAEGTPLRMLGSGGPAREEAVLRALPLDEATNGAAVHGLPVLLGAGMGHAVRRLVALAEQGVLPGVVVVDKETDLLEAAEISLSSPHVLHLASPDTETILRQLTGWQNQHNGLPLLPLVNPFYQRLDKGFYSLLREKLEASRSFNFWEKARQPRFRDAAPRLLLITSRYFLVGEVAEACQRLGIDHRMLTLESDEIASQDFIKALLQQVLEFKPDAVLTLNHLGVDREGVLTDLLNRLELPLASWFVDNPHLVLHLYEGLSSPWMAIFTWDKDNIPSLRQQGFSHVFHLPLGTDPRRFTPNPAPAPASWRSQVSFVGNSMVFKVGSRLKRAALPRALLLRYKEVAAAFTASTQRSVRDFILQYSPEVAAAYNALPDMVARLAYETTLTWESTRQYRTSCVHQLFAVDPAIQPLIVGDPGWKITFRHEDRPWRWHEPLAYYNELPRFYPLSTINFNTTSMQMKGAVNQRVFDVPAAGGFVLTDWRDQMDELFDPETEIATYRSAEEIPSLVRHYLDHPQERERIVQAGRKRVLSCHTWDHRLRHMLHTLKDVFGS